MIHYVENIETKSFLTVIAEMFREYPQFIRMYEDIVALHTTLEEKNRSWFFGAIKTFFESIKDMNTHLRDGTLQREEEEKFVQEIQNQYNQHIQREFLYKNKIQEIEEKAEMQTIVLDIL